MHKINVSELEWNLTDLLKSDDDPKAEVLQQNLTENVQSFVEKWQDRDDYLNDPAVLKEALDEYEVLSASYGTTGKVFYYFWLRTHQDQENPDLKAKYNKAEELSVKLENAIQFFSHRIAKIPETEQQKFLDYPDLSEYRHYLKMSFTAAKYLLSEPEEKLLNLTGTYAHSNWVKMTSDFIGREEREVLDEDGELRVQNFSQILKLLKSQKRGVRDAAGAVVNEILAKYVDIAEIEMNSILGLKKVLDELRGFDRPDRARHLAEDVDTEVVDALVEAVAQKNDISHRFYDLKAKLLGLEKLKYFERSVEYGSINKEYSFEEAVDMVGKTLSKLDTEFYVIFKELVETGRLDVFPRKGKANGAFCVQILKTDPTYVLLNHTGKLTDVTTIAHEIGHAINNELLKKSQNALNCDTSLSTAEVASTFMEDFVLENLLEGADDELKLAVNVMRLDDAISSITRQVACYRFEQELHEAHRTKGYLSKQEIGNLFQKYMSEYMGPFVEQTEGSENWWVYWSHIRSFFYVYSYASGLLISKSLQNMVRANPAEISKVKEFLRAGTSDSPANIFKNLGIDISDREFWLKGLSEVECLLSYTTDLAVKLGKI